MKNRYEVRGETTAIIIKRLDGSTHETLIDTADLKMLQELKVTWKVVYNKKTKSFYVFGNAPKVNGKSRTLSLSRVLMSTPENLQTDHINHDTLNNKRSNLRNVTVSENLSNRRPYHIKKAERPGYRRVYCFWDKSRSKYQVRATLGGKNRSMGRFNTQEEAEELVYKIRQGIVS